MASFDYEQKTGTGKGKGIFGGGKRNANKGIYKSWGPGRGKGGGKGAGKGKSK